MVGQPLPQINENCYSVLQYLICLFLPLFYGSKHSLTSFLSTLLELANMRTCPIFGTSCREMERDEDWRGRGRLRVRTRRREARHDRLCPTALWQWKRKRQWWRSASAGTNSRGITQWRGVMAVWTCLAGAHAWWVSRNYFLTEMFSNLCFL